MAAHAYLCIILITSKGSAQSDDTQSLYKEVNKYRRKVTVTRTGLGKFSVSFILHFNTKTSAKKEKYDALQLVQTMKPQYQHLSSFYSETIRHTWKYLVSIKSLK